MSTKIFNGYKIDSNMSAYSLINLMNKLNKDCQDICNDLYHTEVAKFVSLCLDTKLIFGEDEMNNETSFKYKYKPSKWATDLSDYIDELVEQHESSNERNQNHFDFKCKVKLLPIKDKTLFLLYAEKNEYLDLFGYTDKEDIEYNSKKYPKISPYMYYNNSDKPKHISNEEWDIRREEWDEALRNNENGFIYNLTTTPSILNIDIVIKKIEDMHEKRVDRLVNSKINDLFNEKYKSLITEGGISKYLKELELYRKSDTYKNEFNSIKKEIIKIVPKTYSKEDLKNIKLKNQ